MFRWHPVLRLVVPKSIGVVFIYPADMQRTSTGFYENYWLLVGVGAVDEFKNLNDRDFVIWQKEGKLTTWHFDYLSGRAVSAGTN